MSDLHTDQSLLEALRSAAQRKLSSDQRRQQMVSFIMGSLEDDSTITREKVEMAVRQNSGEAA